MSSLSRACLRAWLKNMPVPRTAGVVCALFAVPVTPYAVPWAPLPVESAKTIRSKTGLAETQRMASFHKHGRCVENVCKRGSVLSLFVRRVMGPGPDVQWLSSEMRNASSTCSKLSFPSSASARCQSICLGLCCVKYTFADFRKTRWVMPTLDSDPPVRMALHK